MRDLMVFLFVVALLPTSIKRPFIGLLLFSWLAYMRPQDLCWGFARSMRLSFFVAFAMVAGWWANEQGKRRFTRWDTRTSLMVLLGLLVTLSYLQARNQDAYTNTYFFEYIKIIVIALFTVSQCDTRERLRWMYWTIALSLGFFGIKNGLLGLARGGGQILRGPGGMLEDNNDFALAMVMNVPMLWYLGIGEAKHRWVQQGMKIGVALTVVTVILTHSRGAFLALCATSLWIAWRSGKLVRASVILLVLGLLFPLLAPQEVLDRLASIGDSKESSRNARLRAWATAQNMIVDNPIWGVGMRNFRPRYAEYSDVVLADPNQAYVAHNSYLQIWAESGTLAFIVYLVLLFSVFFACRRVFRLGRSRPDLLWAANYARMMEATMIGFLCGAFFLNRGHFDLIYHWLALVSALVLVANAAAREPLAGVVTPGAKAHTITLRLPGQVTPAAAGAAVAWTRLRSRWR
jgi:putative inorganic carbon (hco3(-)) transporter